MIAKDYDYSVLSEFMKEYELLCRKYKIIVDACGCCGSPTLTVMVEDDKIDGNIEHLKEMLPSLGAGTELDTEVSWQELRQKIYGYL